MSRKGVIVDSAEDWDKLETGGDGEGDSTVTVGDCISAVIIPALA